MSEHPIRPTRPSDESPKALARKFMGQPARLVVRVDKETLYEVRSAAANSRKSIKRFVLDALQEKGAKIAALDLIDAGDE
jgi:uncharacterized protein (DUF1778 family)